MKFQNALQGHMEVNIILYHITYLAETKRPSSSITSKNIAFSYSNIEAAILVVIYSFPDLRALQQKSEREYEIKG